MAIKLAVTFLSISIGGGGVCALSGILLDFDLSNFEVKGLKNSRNVTRWPPFVTGMSSCPVAIILVFKNIVFCHPSVGTGHGVPRSEIFPVLAAVGLMNDLNGFI